MSKFSRVLFSLALVSMAVGCAEQKGRQKEDKKADKKAVDKPADAKKE